MSYFVRVIKSKRYRLLLIALLCVFILAYIYILTPNDLYTVTATTSPDDNFKEHLIIQNNKYEQDIQYNFNVNYNVHVFYYAWYANPETDGEFRHWNHKYLPSWRKNDQNKFSVGHHYPPGDIGSNFYPVLGCYSSNDPDIIATHMKLLREAQIGVVVLSWRPPNMVDSPENILHVFFDIAAKYNLKVALHIEPYENRSPDNLQEHLKRFYINFGNHSAFYKVKKNFGTDELPLIYIYDSYLTPETEWKEMLSVTGKSSIRDTENDAIFIGLLADIHHRDHIKDSGFDGFYTYFASNGFTYGSSWKYWRSLSYFASQNKLLFIPSVGPGYIDTQVRPWNAENTKDRRNGQYYEKSWKTALDSKAEYISITSFNEWHEGTQIEPAIPKKYLYFKYMDYEPERPNFYMNLTKHWVNQFNNIHRRSLEIGN